MKYPNILLIAAFPVAIENTKEILKSEGISNICGCSDDLIPALEIIKDRRIDLIILNDSCFGNADIIIIIDLLFKYNPDIAIIIITSGNDGNYIRELINRGVRGLVYNKTQDENLLIAVELLEKDGVYFDSTLVFSVFSNKMFTEIGEIKGFDLLTQREREITGFISRGFKNKEIAVELDISIKTVENYKDKIKNKLELKSIKELYKLIEP